jgi:hypothetical protein
MKATTPCSMNFLQPKSGKLIVLDGENFQGESAQVTSALPLSKDEEEVVKRDVLAKAGAKAVTFRVDPSILGGLVIRVGDKVLEARLRQAGRPVRAWVGIWFVRVLAYNRQNPLLFNELILNTKDTTLAPHVICLAIMQVRPRNSQKLSKVLPLCPLCPSY